MTEVVGLREEMLRVKGRVDDLILNELLPRSGSIREVDSLYAMMRDYPARPAKGLRPLICVSACKAMGGSEDDALLTAACVELFQHWVLIHDDIEDGSELRRNQPALHRKYGVPLALNAGDGLHAKMWESLIANRARLGPEKTLSVMEEFSRMVDATTEGQHMELSWVHDGRWDLGEADYYEMCTRKTSWYTVASPCRLGAMIAGAGGQDLERLREFGMKLGVGFQIQDDVLNLTGDPLKYGKTSSDDIVEGKRTLMLLGAMKSASGNERERLLAVMNKPPGEKTPADVAFVVSVMKERGAIEAAQRRARELVDESLKVLAKVRWKDARGGETLASVARFAVERQW